MPFPNSSNHPSNAPKSVTETALLKEKDQPYVLLAPPPIILTRWLVKLSAIVFARVWAVSTTHKTDARAKNFDNFERIFVS